jgi:hypothetical protein
VETAIEESAAPFAAGLDASPRIIAKGKQIKRRFGERRAWTWRLTVAAGRIVWSRWQLETFVEVKLPDFASEAMLFRGTRAHEEQAVARNIFDWFWQPVGPEQPPIKRE